MIRNHLVLGDFVVAFSRRLSLVTSPVPVEELAAREGISLAFSIMLPHTIYTLVIEDVKSSLRSISIPNRSCPTVSCCRIMDGQLLSWIID